MYMFNDKRSHYLFHSGIMGMKWGQRNGPPYPLNRSDYSSKEKKLNPAKNSSPKLYGDKQTKNSPYKFHDNERDNISDKSYRTMTLVQAAIAAASGNPFAVADLVKTGVSNAGDAARDRANKKRQANEKTDPKTGFKLKNYPMTADQDMACVNPHFHNLDENTKQNCVMCTSTFELRRRGYDVTAKKTVSGFDNEDFKVWFPKAQLKQIGPNPTFENCKRYTHTRNVQFEQDIVNEMLSQGDGARGAMNIAWRGSMSGHSLAYEVHDGKVTVYDTQCNKKYDKPIKILKHAYQGTVIRLDKSPINTKMIREVAE